MADTLAVPPSNPTIAPSCVHSGSGACLPVTAVTASTASTMEADWERLPLMLCDHTSTTTMRLQIARACIQG